MARKKKVEAVEETAAEEVFEAKEETGNELAIGDIVHYHVFGECNAAIVTRIVDKESAKINATIFVDAKGSNYSSHQPNISYNEEIVSGFWHWPEDHKESEEVEEVEQSPEDEENDE